MLISHYCSFQLQATKFQITIRTRKTFIDLPNPFQLWQLFVGFHCIAFDSPTHLGHKDLDILPSVSPFFRGESPMTRWTKGRVLRSLMRLVTHRMIRADDNHATRVTPKRWRISILKSYKRPVRFACIFELSNTIHEWFFLTPVPLNFVLASILFR